LHIQNRVRLSTNDGIDDGSVGALIGEETNALWKKVITCHYLLRYSSLRRGQHWENLNLGGMLDFEIGKILHAACQDGALSSTTAKSCSIFGLLPITRIGLWYVVFSFTGLRVSAFLVIPRSMVCASSFHTTLIIHFIYVYIYILHFCIYLAFV